MVHLTNDYRKLLRKNGPKAALSLCVALALSGGLVSAEGKTYDYVNQWGVREALEGDPIEVKWMSGSEGKLQAGTDETNEVNVHALWTWGNPEVYVKGKKITIGDNYPDEKGNPIQTANWGGKISIGGDTTESVTMEGFRTSSEGANTTIQGGSVSMGSLDNWGGTVTVKADGDFRAAKGDNLQNIGVTSGGHLSITAGSMEAGKLTVSDNNSEADIHITGEKGLHFSNSIHTGEHVKITIDSPVIRVDGDNTSWLGNSMDTTNSTVILGNDSSQITMNGRLFNAGSTVTLRGKTIHINAFLPGNSNVNAIENTNGGYNPSGTTIGNKKTENVYVDGKTIVSSSNITLSMAGRNISLSYPKGIALVGRGGKAYIGQKETENLAIAGQVSNQSSEHLNLSGEHITVDSTGYDGSEYKQFPFSESLVTLQNGIDAGDENTKTIFISSGLFAGGGDINVLGKEITVGTSDYLKKYKNQNCFIARAYGRKVNIGSEESDAVHLYGGQLLARGADINVLGKNISVASSADYITPDKDGSVNMIHAKGGKVTIGSKNSDTIALSGGKLLADGKDIILLGHHISLDGKQQWAGETNGGKLTIGSKNSDSVSIQGKGGIHALGGETDIKGKRISIHSDVQNALENAGAPISVGDSGTQYIDVSGGIVSHGSQISLTGRDIFISKGKQENAIHAKGGTVSIHASSDEETRISGPVVNDYGVIDFSFSGKSSYLKSNQVIDNTPGTVRADRYGYLYDRNGKMLEDANGNVLNIHSIKDIPDEAIEGIWLSLKNQASWEPSKDSSIYSYNGDEGHIRLDNESHQTITISKFKDADTRIHEDIYGSKNMGNDTIHIDNTYTGHTHFWLVNREGTDKGVVGTVLASALKKEAASTESASGAKALMMMAAKPMAASASNPIADFQADHFKAFGMNSLYFKTYGLGIKDSEGETADYTKDLYITGVTNHTTNEHGQYTPTVSTALSGSGLMYYTWRTENDKMLQRVGDLRENEGEETGLWARIRGSRIGKSHSDRGFKNQYKVYEIGYDAKTEDNDRMKSFTGIAFSYLDGKGYYADGRGTNQAASAAIYHTDIHKTGHYLDLVFRIRHMNERLHTHTTVDTDIGPITEDHSASMDTTGLSFSAEYGRKKFMGNGWYVEPQTQWTLGYLGPNQYEMDNGTRVEQPGITSFVGRVGFNLGRQVNPNSIVYLKANVYHEFGGHSPIHLYAGDESLSFTDTFDDTWFEYGVGFAMKLGSRLSLYGDFEKSVGSHFYKDWQWNAGIRYSF